VEGRGITSYVQNLGPLEGLSKDVLILAAAIDREQLQARYGVGSLEKAFRTKGIQEILQQPDIKLLLRYYNHVSRGSHRMREPPI